MLTKQILTLVKNSFSTDYIKVIDESQSHVNHVGWREDEITHIHLIIRGSCFDHKSRLTCHRMIYDVLAHLFKETHLHALKITILRRKDSESCQ